jgi:hypothetical protein
MDTKTKLMFHYFFALSLSLMVIVNALRTSCYQRQNHGGYFGQPQLFAPAGETFSIWG